MWWVLLGVVVLIASIIYGMLALYSNGMSDAPTIDGAPLWPALLGIVMAVGLFIWRGVA